MKSLPSKYVRYSLFVFSENGDDLLSRVEMEAKMEEERAKMRKEMEAKMKKMEAKMRKEMEEEFAKKMEEKKVSQFHLTTAIENGIAKKRLIF